MFSRKKDSYMDAKGELTTTSFFWFCECFTKKSVFSIGKTAFFVHFFHMTRRISSIIQKKKRVKNSRFMLILRIL